ncbi:complement C1q-like protein 2 [Sardina pilchardus]|uniref:complement C1q-like protein 2 n=1 Tax=Sardina pilchardus TaxID=27697 RepID=UPI002E0E4FE8
MISLKLIVFLVFVYVADTQTTTESETVVELKSRIEALQRELDAIKQHLKTAVAFSATLQTQKPHEFLGPFNENQKLKYENVITNVGNAYNPNTGIFTVPVKGIYFFTFVLFNPIGNNHPTGGQLMKNTEMVVSATDNIPGTDTEDTTSNSVTLDLEVSDTVYIQMESGRAIYTDGNRRNTFSGHLIHTSE